MDSKQKLDTARAKARLDYAAIAAQTSRAVYEIKQSLDNVAVTLLSASDTSSPCEASNNMVLALLDFEAKSATLMRIGVALNDIHNRLEH